MEIKKLKNMEDPEIKLHYRLKGATEWMEHELTAEEYYEPDEDGREWDSVPMHLHANEYLTVAPAQLEQTVLRLYDAARDLRCTIREVFWNDGQNRMVQRVDDDGMLLIIEIRTGQPPEDLHIIRYDCTLPHDSIIEHFMHMGGASGPSETIVSMTIPNL